MVEKRFVSIKTWGGFDKNKLKKSRIVPKKRRFKKIGYNNLVHWENQKLGQKLVILKKLMMPQIMKGDF